MFKNFFLILIGKKKLNTKFYLNLIVSKIFEWINSSPLNILISYKPDSLVNFNANFFCEKVNYKETNFEVLKSSFIKFNKKNNNGDLNRLISLILNLTILQKRGVKGAFAELGVYKGNTSAILAWFASKSSETLFLFDTFTGFEKKDLIGLDVDKNVSFTDTSIDLVKAVLGNLNDSESKVKFVKGWFPESIQPEHQDTVFSAVSIDCDLYQPMKAGLEFFYPRMAPGGMIFAHDYSSGLWPGATLALDEFCLEHKLSVVLLPDKSGTAVLTKPF
jgi:hypothetical protein